MVIDAALSQESQSAAPHNTGMQRRALRAAADPIVRFPSNLLTEAAAEQ